MGEGVIEGDDARVVARLRNRGGDDGIGGGLGVRPGIGEGDQGGLPHLPNSQSEFCEHRLDGGLLLGGEVIDVPKVEHSSTPFLKFYFSHGIVRKADIYIILAA